MRSILSHHIFNGVIFVLLFVLFFVICFVSHIRIFNDVEH